MVRRSRWLVVLCRLGYPFRSATEGSDFVHQAYVIKPALVAPIMAFAVIVGFAFTWSPWALIAIPFAILGTICGQPNLNLADGCLPLIAIGVGLLIATFHREIGFVIAASSFGGMLAGAAEKTLRRVPYDGERGTPSDVTRDPQKSDTIEKNAGKTGG